MINYIILSKVQDDTPAINLTTGDIVQKFQINVGIDGDTKGFSLTETFTATSNLSKTGFQILADYNSQISDYINTKYNTQ